MTNLSTDELPRHVEDGPVVDHEVPEASTLDPGPHGGVTERLLEEDLVPLSLLGHAGYPRVLVDPGVEEENLRRELIKSPGQDFLSVRRCYNGLIFCIIEG